MDILFLGLGLFFVAAGFGVGIAFIEYGWPKININITHNRNIGMNSGNRKNSP